MLRYIRERYLLFLAVVLAVVAVFTYLGEPNLFGPAFETSIWHSISITIRGFIFLVIVAFSTSLFGLKRGLGIFFGMTLIALPHVLTDSFFEGYHPEIFIEYGFFVPVGAIAIWLVETRGRVEAALGESESRYKTLFETSAEGIIIADLETKKLLYVNPAMCSMLGYSREELESLTVMDIHPRDALNQVMAGFEAQARGELKQVTSPCLMKDGTVIYADITASLTTIDGRRCNVGFFSDVTGREKIQTELREINQDLKVAQRLTSIGNWKWVIATNIVTWSEELCHINGWNPEIPVPPFAEMGAFYTPESWSRLSESVAKAASNGEPFELELEQISTDGTKIKTLSRGEADFDASGKIVGLHGTVQDITARKKMEDDLQRSGEFFKAVFNSTNDAILVIDVNNFTVVRANDAFLQQKGWKEEQVIGKTCYEITHRRSDPCMPPDDICPLTETVITGGHSVAEHVHYTRDNQKVYVEVSTFPLKDGNGKVVQVVHVSRDLTERRKMQEQLIAQDRLASIGQLVSGVAHELNNPLTSVIGFSELLLQKELPDDVRADLKIVNDEAKRTSYIVRNLLTFARQQPQEKRAIDVNVTVKIVLQLRSHEQSLNNIKVNVHFAPDLPQIMGNSSQLQQVFFNLVTNAEQAILEANKKGTLTITTEQAGDFLRVSIADDGPGINSENMRKLFTPFFTTKGVGKGTGLGLSICQGIITEHGGRIWAESQPGKGTTFIIELPVWNGAIS